MKHKSNDPRFTEILFTSEEIQIKVKELANWVNETYKNSKDLIFIGLLKGCLPFLIDLAKNVTVEHIWDFMTLSTYSGSTESSGNVKVVMDLKQNIFDKDVLIIEDIVDSGITLEKVVGMLKMKQPKSLKILTLLDKRVNRKNKLEVDKAGFIVPNKFLAGYGLDVKEKLRNIDFIGVFNQEYLDKL
ncbi:hypoxanthine phosphoribosyltransferase [[Mycoplasma] mobile]|uniref:Hypoxanthine phosphoribosyltransferase n=1 Tax=Mycoplasma mobile (strain ATCC 43663 / 163K / NCTC 11711) TaxID=267748 RepID=Q6KHL0_MYCM1|nr:hypoxanthine phosphoribosyltransferase [[Mycoplasma] mobile]AAT27920.1 hypoxanthine-guanine phosphoribosyltransferase [Mycoplasma mobile 163K]